jgi:hypothetical protein
MTDDTTDMPSEDRALQVFDIMFANGFLELMAVNRRLEKYAAKIRQGSEAFGKSRARIMEENPNPSKERSDLLAQNLRDCNWNMVSLVVLFKAGREEGQELWELLKTLHLIVGKLTSSPTPRAASTSTNIKQSSNLPLLADAKTTNDDDDDD